MKNGFEVSFSNRNLSYKNKSKKKWGATKKVGRLSERKRVVAGRGDGIFAIFPKKRLLLYDPAEKCCEGPPPNTYI